MEIHICAALIRRLHAIRPVSDALMARFYDLGIEYRRPKDVLDVYLFTKLPQTIARHQYAVPPSLALLALFNYCFKRGHDDAARQLVADIVEHNIYVPPSARIGLLINIARSSWPLFSQTLYDRFVADAEMPAKVVKSSPAVMLILVSQFHQLLTSLEHSIELQEQKPHLDSKFLHPNILRQRQENVSRLISKIMSNHIAEHEPLEKADHKVLTTLARAHFIIGDFAKGFDLFRIVMNRADVLDLYDMNVALSAMAEVNPRVAARMVDRMVQQGIAPNSVTYGTIMHQAYLHDDEALVRDMAFRMRTAALSGERLSIASTTNILLSNLGVKLLANTAETTRTELAGALNMLTSINDVRMRTSRTLRTKLVSMALKADTPVLAFKFWLLMFAQAEWDSRQHVFFRRLIIHAIREHRHVGRLDAKEANGMLAALHGFKKKSAKRSRSRRLLPIQQTAAMTPSILGDVAADRT
ncbi:hypothetical protein FISHEDRAFT_50678 [Fistulina hepatica ATCC 64428]|uniref:Pentacotripeptide-repeat region of PRORP domain-containing protein n=1 Tax=Fistulina hepatica ATCC 64428 TaxID=1128425 RepID=A0A0D7A321_9AGAR|nr:hypothetical protein FISHEDRAFT_50678 [Fistulina hepatica ATCC 64428]